MVRMYQPFFGVYITLGIKTPTLFARGDRMKYLFSLKQLLLVFLLLVSASGYVLAATPEKGLLTLNGINLEVWASYKIRHMLFPKEEWEFCVIVAPKDVRQGTLIKIAKDFYAKYPDTGVRFFSDKKHIQQYADRDRYMNDKTGKVREVGFPNQECVQNHLLGNINNRSSTYQRRWMLEDRYGNNISLLPQHLMPSISIHRTSGKLRLHPSGVRYHS